MALPAAPSNGQSLRGDEFDRIRELVNQLTGIVLTDHKRPMVFSRLSRRLSECGEADVHSYLDAIEGNKTPGERERFINAMTTNLTSFFREPHHFEHLATTALPRLPANGRDRLRIWSAGCSTGEEPYSIALTLLDLQTPPRDCRILATDIDTAVLTHARAGVYADTAWDAMPGPMRKHIARATDGGVQVGKAAKSLIKFNRLNLIEAWPMSGPFDIIFCRNVMIYFESPTKLDLVNRFAELLRPGGTLYLGHSEALLAGHPRLSNEGRTTYRRMP